MGRKHKGKLILNRKDYQEAQDSWSLSVKLTETVVK